MASAFSQYALLLVGNRLVRELWMFGWPTRSVLLCSEEVGEETITLQDLSADLGAHRMLETSFKNREVAGLDNIAERSVFDLLPVKQLYLAAARTGWVLTPELQAWAQARFRKVIMSQLVEDSFNRMKLSSRQQLNRTAREVLHYKHLAESPVLDEVHHFSAVPWGAGTSQPPQQDVGRDTFHAKVASMSIKTDGLVSLNPKATWYSPAANRLSVCHADVWVRRQALKESQGLTRIRKLWLGVFMKLQHCLIVRTKAGSTAGDEFGPWLLPLKYLPDSGCVFWDTTVKRSASGGYYVLPSFSPGPEPIIHAVWDLNAWECMEIKWVSPAGQAAKGVTRSDFGSWGVKAEVMSPPMSLMQAGARSAFWEFDKPLLDKLCQEFGITVPPGSSIFQTLLAMVSTTLDLEEEAALEILGRRLDVATGAGTNLEDFLELEEAAACLDEGDRKELVEEQRKIATQVSVCRNFKEAWRMKRKDISEAKAKAVAKSSGGRGRAKAKAKAVPKRPLPAGLIDQSQARVLCPPGGHIWRANTGHAWQGHYRPYSRISRSWHLYGGNRQALVLVLQTLWRQHLEFSGLRCPQDCPITGLLEHTADEAS